MEKQIDKQTEKQTEKKIKCKSCELLIPANLGYPTYRDDICDNCIRKIEEAEEIKRRVVASGMKPKHLDMTFENYRFYDKELVSAAKDFCEKKKTNIFIYGTPGTGKTHLLSAMANTVIKREFIRFYRTIDLLDKTRSLIVSDGILAADELINTLTNGRHYLFLDDLGVEKVTDTIVEKLYMLFDNIELQKTKGVALVSNYKLPELVTRLGDDRIVDRIVGNFLIKEIKGESERIKGRKLI